MSADEHVLRSPPRAVAPSASRQVTQRPHCSCNQWLHPRAWTRESPIRAAGRLIGCEDRLAMVAAPAYTLGGAGARTQLRSDGAEVGACTRGHRVQRTRRQTLRQGDTCSDQHSLGGGSPCSPFFWQFFVFARGHILPGLCLAPPTSHLCVCAQAVLGSCTRLLTRIELLLRSMRRRLPLQSKLRRTAQQRTRRMAARYNPRRLLSAYDIAQCLLDLSHSSVPLLLRWYLPFGLSVVHECHIWFQVHDRQ